jgi:tRNA1Val (adenine37-N6)-methyltransferase
MANDYFQFKQFTIKQNGAAFKVTTDSVLLGAWADLTNAKTILDIGTGTGLLALMSAQRSQAKITAIEPDEMSFSQAKLNVLSTPWHDRITLLNYSLQEFLGTTNTRFDSIISNPPFFSGSLLNPDPRKAMARHNATLSSEFLLTASEKLLSENGTLNLVLPVNEGENIIEIAPGFGLFCQRIMRIRPTDLRQPRRLLITFGHREVVIREESLTIEEGTRHNYSDEYKTLTGDFYLDKQITS